MGKVSEFQALMRDSLTSTTVTVIPGHICAITLHVGPPTYPAPIQQILFISNICKTKRRAGENAAKHEGLDKPTRNVNHFITGTPGCRNFLRFFYFVSIWSRKKGGWDVLTFSLTGLRCRDIATNELMALIFLTATNDFS